MTKETIDALGFLTMCESSAADRRVTVRILPSEAREILDMREDLRYAGEAVDRAYRQCEPDPRQLSLVERYAEPKHWSEAIESGE